MHAISKRIEVHYHFVREKINNNEIELFHVPSASNLADILTKPLGRIHFHELRDQLNIYCRRELLSGHTHSFIHHQAQQSPIGP